MEQNLTEGRPAKMKTKQEVEAVVLDYASQIKALLGDKLDAVILFGSYARGDYEDGSDVDVMVLVHTPQEQLAPLRSKMRDIAFELEWKYQLLLSTVLESAEIVYKYKDASGFFKNVLDDGVRISA
jgi:predicted nucleotidyltransferase